MLCETYLDRLSGGLHVAEVVLQVIDAPRCISLCIQCFVPPAAREALACLVAGVTESAMFQNKGV